MEAKLKAEELVLKFLRVENNTPEWFNTHIAKQCALIAVEQMILVLPFTNTNSTLNEYAINLQKYLEQVKKEIQLL